MSDTAAKNKEDETMETYHGKHINPRKFKQRDLANLTRRVSEKRQRAEQFLEQATVDIEECYVCGSPERDVVREVYGYRYARCRNCSHQYLTRRLPQDVLYEYYETDSEFASTYTDEAQIQYRLKNITKPKIDFVIDHIEPTEGRWLDVGCGIGASISYLESQGWDAVGLDLSEECVAVAKDQFGVTLQQKPLNEFAADSPGEFDVVSFFGYLEMVPHAMSDLKLVAELLGEDGYVVAGGSNADSVSTLVHRSMPDMAVRHSIPPIGIHQFTPDSLDEAFYRTGFETEVAWFFGLDFYELLNHLRLTVDGFDSSELYDYLMAQLDAFQRVIDENEQSDYILAVGRRT